MILVSQCMDRYNFLMTRSIQSGWKGRSRRSDFAVITLYHLREAVTILVNEIFEPI